MSIHKYVNNLIFESLNDNTSSLYDIYNISFEEYYYNNEFEALSHRVSSDEQWFEQLPIIIINLNNLKTYMGDKTVIDSYRDYVNDEQNEIIKSYIKNKSYGDSLIVVEHNSLLDGNHRVVAAILDGKSTLKGIDISDSVEY